LELKLKASAIPIITIPRIMRNFFGVLVFKIFSSTTL